MSANGSLESAMRHVTRYRIYPSQKIAGRLFASFARCAFVRNWCLENKVYQDSCLPTLKTEYPELKEVHSKVLQNVVSRSSTTSVLSES